MPKSARSTRFLVGVPLLVFAGFTSSLASAQDSASRHTAALREVFTLSPGESVSVAEADLTIELVALGYRRCPPFARCPLPDGPVVDYRVLRASSGEELHSGESFEAPPDRFPFFVLSMGQQDENSARFSVHRTHAWCDEYSTRADQHTCLAKVSLLSGDIAYCERIRSDDQRRMTCIEGLAERTDRAELCLTVKLDTGWCGYQRATGNLVDIFACGRILSYALRDACFRSAYEQYRSMALCDPLPAGSARRHCMDVIADIRGD